MNVALDYVGIAALIMALIALWKLFADKKQTNADTKQTIANTEQTEALTKESEITLLKTYEETVKNVLARANDTLEKCEAYEKRVSDLEEEVIRLKKSNAEKDILIAFQEKKLDEWAKGIEVLITQLITLEQIPKWRLTENSVK
jgi:selenophosphate synthase